MRSRIQSALLVAAILVVSIGAWAGRDQSTHQRTPIDVGAIADLDLRYGQRERNTLDLYRPSTPGPHPVVIYFHPGGWVEGDKSMSLPIWDWTEQGYAVVSVNYSYAESPGTIRHAVDDAERAVRFVLANSDEWDLDDERVGLFGFSAGGHLASMLSQRELPLRAVAVLGAPTNLAGLLDPATPFFDGATGDGVVTLMTGRLGCDGQLAEACIAEATDLSPTHGLAGVMPMLIIHGVLDPIVDLSHATELHESLRRQGADVELVLVPDAMHGASIDALGPFFDTHLQPSG